MRSKNCVEAQRDSSGPAHRGRHHKQVAQTSFFHMSRVFEGKHCRLKALVLTDQVPVRYMLSVSSSLMLATLSNFLDPSSLVCCMHFLPVRIFSSVPAFPQTHVRLRATYGTVPSSPSLISMTNCSRVSPHLWGPTS